MSVTSETFPSELQRHARTTACRWGFRAALLLGFLTSQLVGSRAHAAQMVDDFTSGAQNFQATNLGCGISSEYAGAGPLGGARDVGGRDGFSTSTPVGVKVTTSGGGTAEVYSTAGAPEELLMWGTRVGTYNLGFGCTVVPGYSGSQLNLNLALTDRLVIDVGQLALDGSGAGVDIVLATGSGNFSKHVILTSGVNNIVLSSFAGLTAPAAADIDGLSFEFFAKGAQGSGTILNAVSFVNGAVVPTLSQWGMILLAALLAITMVVYTGRQAPRTA